MFIRATMVVLVLTSALTAQNADNSTKTKSREASHAKASVETTIIALEKKGVEAALKGDSSWGEKYLADDYIGIGSRGQQIDKKTAAENLKSGKTKYEKIEMTETKVTQYGPSVAISRGTANVKLTYDGKPIEGAHSYSRVWVKRNGKWQAIAFQSTQQQ